MIFSVTERKSFRRCRRQWYVGSFNGQALTAAMPKPALNTGSNWHRALELWATATGDDARAPLTSWVELACNENEQHVDAALESTRKHGLTIEERGELIVQRNLLLAMANNYQAHWKTPIPEQYTFVSAEQTVIVPIPGTVHHLESTLDGLIKHVDTGAAYILEHKTFGNHPVAADLIREDQFVAYVWVLQQLGKLSMVDNLDMDTVTPDDPTGIGYAVEAKPNPVFGWEVGGVAYDGAWKREAPTKTYPHMSDLFLRMPINYSQDRIDSFEQYLATEVNEMAQAVADPAYRYPSPNEIFGTCNDCGIKELCDAMNNKEDVDFLLSNFYVPRDPGDRREVWPIFTKLTPDAPTTLEGEAA